MALRCGAVAVVLAGAAVVASCSLARPPARVAGPTPPTSTASAAVPPISHTVVALGDSVTAGTACGCVPFPQAYAAALAREPGYAVPVVNLGRAGLTARGLAAQLRDDAATRTAMRQAGTVVVTVGANDLVPLVDRRAAGACPSGCVEARVAAMAGNLSAALSELRAEAPQLHLLLVTTYWNVFEDGDVGDALRGHGFAAWSDGVTRSANAAICRSAEAAHAVCVDLYTPFEGPDGHRNPTPLLADDGDHPNAVGHAVIASALLRAKPSG